MERCIRAPSVSLPFSAFKLPASNDGDEYSRVQSRAVSRCFTSEECSLMSVMTVAYFTDGRVCTLQLTTRHGYETVAQNGLWVYCVSIGAMLVDG